MLTFQEWVESKRLVKSLDDTFGCEGVCGTEEDHPGWVYGGDDQPLSFIIKYKDGGNTKYCLMIENSTYDSDILGELEVLLYNDWAKDEMWHNLSVEEQEKLTRSDYDLD